MTRAKPLPANLPENSFTLGRARSLGLRRSRLRAKDLLIPSREIRLRRDAEPDLAERCRPYLDLLPDAFLSHVTAARLHGLPLPRLLQAEPTIHLSRASTLAVPRRRNVTGHRLLLEPGELTVCSGLPVTSLARTLLDLSTVLSLEDLVAAGDWVISEHQRNFGSRRTALLPVEELRRYVSAKAGVPGLPRLRAAVGLMRVGVDSPPETRIRLLLGRAGLPEFTPNTAILDETGDPALWVDLGCRQYRTCIEYDGAHHLTPAQQSRDHHRDLLTHQLGWHQVRINKFDVAQGPEWVVGKVRQALVRGGWTP
ncbi:DUF559 domain-containing protein [Arthrobacter sp. Sa2CUA1]|uniref:DUF559 domain-containing protein n=1 Tax=Arthrobacter gallicola TaxID=2762225 RepID=A0ABR8UU11_9MICC|nr:DUF559 domain-containing protein [Arthrobacter gallicola]MBD7996035.1 DUF559 domain-containing protein [Arthrobacter gallicola]